MVRIANLAIALVAAASSVSAYDNECPPGRTLCGFTLNDGFYGYTRQELIDALVEAGQNPNVPDIIEHSQYACTDDNGSIEFVQFCGPQLCTAPVVGNPECPGGPLADACCKPAPRF